MRAAMVFSVVPALVAATLCQAETLPLSFDEGKFERPDRKPVDGTVPREVLFLICVQRGKVGEEESRTRFCTYDMARPEDGFRDRFSAPTEHQYFRFVTPLFGGWGIAVGSFDKDGKPESGREAFWLNPFTAEKGPKVLSDPAEEWTSGTELRLMKQGSLHRFDLATGVSWNARFRIRNLVLRDRDRILATSDSLRSVDSGKEMVLDIHLDRGEAEVLAADLPSEPRAGWGECYLRPAGNDGVFYARGFCLYWLPKGGTWREVIHEVNIVKTHGGRDPWLPVTYVGERRFAVARTVPNSLVRERRHPNTALSVTMLVDGESGKILDETEPERYDFNPPCTVPEKWWSKSFVAEMEKESKARARGPDLFRFDDKAQTVTYAGGKRLALTEDQEVCLSLDGRTLVVYEKWSRESDKPPRLEFTLIDGIDGSNRTISVVTDKAQIFVQSLAWVPLCAPEVTPEAMDRFRAARWHPFYDPWR